jgi:hypothetical protein
MNMSAAMIPVLASIAVVLGTGCGTTIRYDLSDLPMAQPDPERQAMRVAVAPLHDGRPREERKPSFDLSLSQIKTIDWHFKGRDVGRGISEAMVSHFNHARLFETAKLDGTPIASPSEGVLDEMQALGYNALLTGTIAHFQGCGHMNVEDRFLHSEIGLLFLPVAMAKQNRNEGCVELTDVRLTSTVSGDVLWSGSFGRKQKFVYWDVMPVRAVCETLKEVIKEMVKQLEATSFALYRPSNGCP